MCFLKTWLGFYKLCILKENYARPVVPLNATKELISIMEFHKIRGK